MVEAMPPHGIGAWRIMGVPRIGVNMRKKQTPVAMVSLLVAVGGAVVVFGVLNRPLSDEEKKKLTEKVQKDAVQPVGAPRTTISKTDLGNTVVMPTIAQKKEGEGDEDASISPIPTILKSSATGNKPRPGDSDLNPQWYKKEHGKQQASGGS